MNTSVVENGTNCDSMDDMNCYKNLLWIFHCAINLILTLPANAYTLWLIVTRVDGTLALEFFTLNLAVSEILYSLSRIMCFVLTFLKPVIMYSFFFWSGLIYTSRLVFQCCMCVECYLGVVHPVIFLRYKPLRYRVACCSVVWMLVLSSCLFCLFGSDLTIFCYVYLTQYLVLLSVTLFCCLSVLRVLNQPGPGEGRREREGNNDVKRRAFKTMIIIFTSMILTYSAHVIAMSLKNVYSYETYGLALVISSCIATMTGFIQPFLYFHRAGKLTCIKVC